MMVVISTDSMASQYVTSLGTGLDIASDTNSRH
jgi:hypothetical protein